MPYLRPLKTNEQAFSSISLADKCTLSFEALCSKMLCFKRVKKFSILFKLLLLKNAISHVMKNVAFRVGTR